MHYLVGGTLALPYAALSLGFGAPPDNYVFTGFLWGLATAVLPWLFLYPVYGWGFFGGDAPKGTRPILSPIVLHSIYGLGLGIFLSIML